jgi:hypothetical protein
MRETLKQSLKLALRTKNARSAEKTLIDLFKIYDENLAESEPIEDAISLANLVATNANWGLVSRLLPPGTNSLETSGWLRSMAEGAPVDQSGSAIPWLNYSVIDFIESKIHHDTDVFEWGSGYSTLWYQSKVRTVESCEDDEIWFQKIRGEISENVTLKYLPSKDDYINQVRITQKTYDVIQVDGSHRNDCAMACISKLKPDGFIVFDNSDSKMYDESLDYLSTVGFFRIDFVGLIPSYLYKNCTSILFRDAKLLRPHITPSKTRFSTGMTCFQSMNA